MSGKYLVAGLGNPGEEYAHTRHNVGWDIATRLVEAAGGSFEGERYGDVAQIRIKSSLLTVLRPNTFMNLSGKAVHYWAEKVGVEGAGILVLVDDIALPLGALRLKGQGSPGGHNGLKNISELLATDHYARLRFGIGADYPKGAQVDYVLGRWNEDLRHQVEERMDVAVEMVKSYVCAGLEITMNQFNGK